MAGRELGKLEMVGNVVDLLTGSPVSRCWLVVCGFGFACEKRVGRDIDVRHAIFT